MHDMTDEERRDFLVGTAHTAKCAVVRKDGRPNVTPIWFVLDGDDVIFTTHTKSVKGHAIRRDGRVALCVDDDRPPFSYVAIEGVAEVSTDLEQMLAWATRIGGRYMGADRAEEYGRRNAVEGELLVRLRPTKVLARADIAG
ncbi:MAG TPA: PPOX class F420-dependent oxidoreductase [Solirubrobacteraceae bacterium]|jgi:PPOX class probable F420-dependent enzyme